MAILTISREIGTDGLEIGKTIAKEMGYEFFDKKRVLDGLKARGPEWEKVVDALEGHAPSLWEKYDRQYRGFVAFAQSHVLDCALSGNAVIMGRGANFLLENIPYALNVRLVAPMDVRLKKATRDDGCSDFVCISPETSQSVLERADKESENLVHSAFGKDWKDVLAYDMVLNMGRFTFEEAVEILKTSLGKREGFRDAEAENRLRKRALTVKVKSAILTDPAVSVPTLEVGYAGEEIVVRGVVHNAKEHRLVEEEAKKVAGAVPVRCELQYR